MYVDGNYFKVIRNNIVLKLCMCIRFPLRIYLLLFIFLKMFLLINVSLSKIENIIKIRRYCNYLIT